MKKKALVLVLALMLCCLFAICVSAAEPSSSDEFGDVSIITDNDAINALNDFGYSDGDTARVVVKVPGTETYLTYPMYYFFGARDDGKNGYQPLFNVTAINGATGLVYDESCIIRLELPDVFTAVSKNYSRTNLMTNLKYVHFKSSLFGVHAGAFNNLKALTTVVWDSNDSTEINGYIGGNGFENCTSLTSIDLPSQLTSMGERALAGCTSLTSVTIPSRITAIATANFMGCTNLKTVEFENIANITSINHRSFDGCVNLEGDFAFENVTTIGSIAFQNTSKNEGCYFNLSLPNVVSIGQQAFLNSGVKSLSLSEEFKYESNNWNTFMNCTKLEYADLSMCTVKQYPVCFLAGCTGLKIVELNDNIEIIEKQMFAGCTSLGFLYLPKSVTSFSTNTEWQKGAFYDCKSLYFVTEDYSIESFLTNGVFDATKYEQNKPAKERVYYFPSALTSLAQCFRGCNNINEVLVVGENVTVFNETSITGLGTSNETMTVVFLGKMTSFKHTEGIGRKVDIIMPNTTEATLTTVATGNRAYNGTALYLCQTGRKCTLGYNSVAWSDEVYHFAEKTEATDATCTMPKMVASYCYCGTIMGEPQTEGEALGHSHTIYLGIAYENYMVQGSKQYKCERCGDVNNDEKVDALFTWKGYSYSQFADMNNAFSIVQSYYINKEAIAEYEAEKEITINFGFIATGNKSENGLKPTIGEDKVVSTDLTNLIHDYFDIKISGISDAYIDTKFIFCAYMIIDDTMYYLDAEETKTEVIGVSYNDVVEIKNAE